MLKVAKLSLAWLKYFKDENVKTLLNNCKKLSALDLRGCPITNISVDSIIEHSKLTLEELSLSYTNVNYAKLIELKLMSKLKTLNCLHIELFEIDKLKLEIPQLWINQQIKVASMGDGGSFEPEEGFWEIQAKQIEFRENHGGQSAVKKRVSGKDLHKVLV